MLDMIDDDKEYKLKQNDSRKKKILCVDEDAPDNEAIIRIMEYEPMYEVIATESIDEAMKIIEMHHFNLLFMDAKLWNDATKLIQHVRGVHRVPIVLSTDDAALEIFRASDRYDCDDYITKPFLPLLVKEVVYNMTREL